MGPLIDLISGRGEGEMRLRDHRETVMRDLFEKFSRCGNCAIALHRSARNENAKSLGRVLVARRAS